MDFFEVVKKRRSTRSFKKEEKIPDEVLYQILETAIQAPSAGNRQSWDFVVVKTTEIKKALAKAALGQGFIARASVVVVVCANQGRSAVVYGRRGVDLYSIQDTAAAIQTMLLTITALGYGACWVGAFSESEVRKILKVTDGVRPVAIIPIGVPKRTPKPTPRIPLEDLIHHESY